MAFDFDNFVNKPAMGIFGRPVTYRPRNPSHAAFEIIGDFHQSYMEIDLKNATADISSTKIVLFVRMVDFPPEYPKPLQGDYVTIWETEYQIVDCEPHIPGSRKLILHETT